MQHHLLASFASHLRKRLQTTVALSTMVKLQGAYNLSCALAQILKLTVTEFVHKPAQHGVKLRPLS
jgi:hypothetical protein